MHGSSPGTVAAPPLRSTHLAGTSRRTPALAKQSKPGPAPDPAPATESTESIHAALRTTDVSFIVDLAHPTMPRHGAASGRHPAKPKSIAPLTCAHHCRTGAFRKPTGPVNAHSEWRKVSAELRISRDCNDRTEQRCLLAQHRLRVGVAPNGHSRAVAPRHAAPADRHRVAPHETSCLFQHIAIGHGSASGAHSAAHSACSARRQYVSDVHASTTRSPCAHGLRTSQQHSQQSAESPNRFGLWIRCCDWVRSDSQPIQPSREGT